MGVYDSLLTQLAARYIMHEIVYS